MPWFRRKRTDELQDGGAIAIAPAEEIPEPTELEEDGAEGGEPAATDGSNAPKRKRRRGSRGGKGRKKSPAVATADGGGTAQEAPAM